MKIAIIGPAYPFRGGIADFNENLAQSLKQENHACKIFSFSLQYPRFLFPGKTQYKEGAAPPDLNIEHCINSIQPTSWYRTAKKIKDYAPDLIIVRFWIPFMGAALGTICKKLKKKYTIIALTDNVIPHEKRPGDRWLTKYFLKQCSGFITLSGAVEKDLQSLHKNNFTIVTPHPIYYGFGASVEQQKARQILNLSKDDFIILFFGLVRKYKGLDLLIESLKHINHKNWKLVIAGEFYDDEKIYKQMIDKFNLSQNVVIINQFIPDAAVKNYFSAASVVAQTYRTATQSGVAQIAYHFDKPMIVTDVGGLPEIIPHNKAGKVAHTSPESIAEQINSLIEAPEQLKKFKTAMQTLKKQFEWPAFIEKAIDLKNKIEDKDAGN